jgi:hypothetical protein
MNNIASIFIAGTFALTFAAAAQESQPLPPKVAQNPETTPATEPTTPHHPDENSRLLQEWSPPSDESHASGSGDERGFLAHYLSTKPLAEVWAHYAAKLGLTPMPAADQAYQSNLYTQVFPPLGPRVTDGHATLTVKNVQFQNETERGATLTRREPSGRTIVVHLASQGDQTFVFVMVSPAR